MTIMLTSCKDSITNMELVAIGSNISKVEFDKRTFIYDENRGYLLGN